MGKTAYGYLRVSGKGQVNGDGFDRQEAEIWRYASKHGYQILTVYRDEGISGTTDEADRPAFQAMVADILRNGTRTVIVEGLDRLAREYRVQEALLIYLASKGITLINARTEEDITEAVMADPMRKALVQIQGVFAELEKSLLVKKLRAARDRKRAETGRCEGRKVYHTTPEGQAALAEIKRLRRKPRGTTRRMTYAEVAAALNAKGLKTSIGREWTLQSVQDFLQSAKPGRKE